MDVDLLKPGSVPISRDTVLSFEFLLDKDLLYTHLHKPNPDPSPTDLITKFYEAVAVTLKNRQELEPVDCMADTGSNELKIKLPAKNIAMKILSLKVAAHLNWNLAQLRSLPFKTQINLLQDLMYFTSEERAILDITNIEQIDIKSASPQFLFALLLFYRWLLNTSMHRITSNWQQRYGINEMSPADESIICCPENIKKTIQFLTDALQWDEVPHMLTFECFQMPTEENDTIEFQWTKASVISREEFSAEICYDLGTFFYYREEYEAAKLHFFKCKSFLNSIVKISGFATIDGKVLEIYMKACDPAADVHKKGLLEQLNSSIVNQFVGVTNVLQQDNLQKDIPLAHRINLELDIQGALSSGAFTVARDLLLKVKALNYVRCVLDRKSLNELCWDMEKNVDSFLWAVQVNWKLHSEEDKKLIKDHLLLLLIKDEIHDLLTRIKASDLSGIFSKAELILVKKHVVVDVPELLLKSESSFGISNKKRKPRAELRRLSKQLISTCDWKEIKDILTKIGMTNMGVAMWDINPQWELPIPLQSVVKNLPRGLLLDFTYVLLAKSKEQLQSRNWTVALELLIVLDKELQSAASNNTMQKLIKMVNWEVLLVQITQMLEEWPQTSVDKTALANACEVCLQVNDSSVLPRREILEACALCLLNLGRWEFLVAFEKRWTSFEVMSAVAATSLEMVKHKGTKKFPKELWDIVLPAFAPNPSQSKRGSYHDTSNLKTNVLAIVMKLRDARCLTAVISMFTKLYNVFRDEANMELQVECMNLWPATVSNANSYNLGAVSEMLSEVIRLGLKHYPNNVPWLRLMGDVNYSNGNYKISLSFYLKSLIICNDYFNIPMRCDDHVFRRMIKCCQALGCHTQAAVLCQFLEEPDYSLAFRILGEQKSCNDAVDAYYHCFWDTNILEFLIHTHNRRGEFQRRKCAIQVMGMLELNSNNNEEIQREASNLRKSVFLRALCKQYVF
ncbi:integrator complex subunit 8 [Euwallacea fornicatus]|uniref:integrator complex subunit 8 n=1 Tax=Euwallacea fornicatus TaxID=995702 RepID=UPI00338D9588